MVGTHVRKESLFKAGMTYERLNVDVALKLMPQDRTDD